MIEPFTSTAADEMRFNREILQWKDRVELLTDMNGLEVVTTLHSDIATSSVPIVMLSAGQELDAAERARAAGAVAYLRKPVLMQTLIETIQRYASNPGEAQD